MAENQRLHVGVLLIAMLGLFFFGGSSLAVASELPPGVIVGDDSGIKADVNGKYFIEHTDIKPGLTFTKDITISNYSQEKEPFDLRLDMESDTVEGALNLLEAINVTLELEGKQIYEGTLSGQPTDPTITLPLYLGKYDVGDTKVLKATFKVASDLPKEVWNQPNNADFYWGFQATREDEPAPKPDPDPTPKPDPKPTPIPLPQTGEEWGFVLMGVIIGVFIVMISLIVAKKRRSTT